MKIDIISKILTQGKQTLYDAIFCSSKEERRVSVRLIILMEKSIFPNTGLALYRAVYKLFRVNF